MGKIPPYTDGKVLRRYGGMTSESVIKYCKIAELEKALRTEQYKEEARERFKKIFGNKKWR